MNRFVRRQAAARAQRRGGAPGTVVLLPGVPQRLWRTPAVVNFVAGGLGAGLYVAAGVAAGDLATPALTVASVLGPALVLLGFIAVAAEAGRPLRGLRVLARPHASWMSRELWLGGAFTAVALGAWPRALGLAAVAAGLALAFAAAQGAVLRASRGVPAWSGPLMPLVFLASAMASGTAALVLIEAVLGSVPPSHLGGLLVLVAAHAAACWAYLDRMDDPVARQDLAPLAEGAGLALVAGAGTLAPVALAGLALGLPGQARPLAAVAGALVILAHAGAKALLVRRGGRLRSITLTSLTLGRTPS